LALLTHLDGLLGLALDTGMLAGWNNEEVGFDPIWKKGGGGRDKHERRKVVLIVG